MDGKQSVQKIIVVTRFQWYLSAHIKRILSLIQFYRTLFTISLYVVSCRWALAQQNFFNIPSGQLTPKGKLFYQHQVNAYSAEKLASKQHLVRGFADDIEFGLNFVNFYPSERYRLLSKASDPPVNLFAVTGQKGFQFSSSLNLNLGSQMGLGRIGMSGEQKFSAKHYGLLSYYIPGAHTRLTGGAFLTSGRFNGTGSDFGVMLGGEAKISETWYLMGDWISGSTKNSAAVLGGMLDVANGVQLCLGYLIPNPGSREGRGVVVEINLFNF